MHQLTKSGVYGLENLDFLDARGRSTRYELPENVMFKPQQLLSVHNNQNGTLRGLHFQNRPKAETKILHCLLGTIFDVLVNLDSLGLPQPDIFSIELGKGCEYQGLLIPSNFAHGYLTTSEHSDLLYLMDQDYEPSFASGIRWDDPKLRIDWPSPPNVISDRDSLWPHL